MPVASCVTIVRGFLDIIWIIDVWPGMLKVWKYVGLEIQSSSTTFVEDLPSTGHWDVTMP